MTMYVHPEIYLLAALLMLRSFLRERNKSKISEHRFGYRMVRLRADDTLL